MHGTTDKEYISKKLSRTKTRENFLDYALIMLNEDNWVAGPSIEIYRYDKR